MESRYRCYRYKASNRELEEERRADSLLLSCGKDTVFLEIRNNNFVRPIQSYISLSSFRRAVIKTDDNRMKSREYECNSR